MTLSVPFKPVAPRFTTSAVEAGARRAKPVSPVLDLPLDAVDGGEIIIFAIKPSMWSPVIESAAWLAGAIMLAVVCTLTAVEVGGMASPTLAQLIIAAAALRFAVATFRWVSCWYVLTNRRVVEIHGVRTPRVTSAMLIDIRNTGVTSMPHERLLRLGTITFVSKRPPDPPWQWKHLHDAAEAHAAIRRAIENALDALP